MVRNVNYISINEILSRITRHKKLQSVTLEEAIQYTLDFIGIFGMPNLYLDKEALVEIKSYRGELPCDLISVTQVKDCRTNLCMRSTTDSFSPNRDGTRESTFKTKGQVIFTNFEEGTVLVAYKAIAVDENGYPMVIDDPKFLSALELYIKREVFTDLFDNGDITAAVYQNVQQQYCWAAGRLQSAFTTPSISEMESIKRMWTTRIQRMSSFNDGFSTSGDQEYIKRN